MTQTVISNAESEKTDQEDDNQQNLIDIDLEEEEEDKQEEEDKDDEQNESRSSVAACTSRRNINVYKRKLAFTMDYDLQTNVTLDSSGDLSYHASQSRIAKEVILTIFFVFGMSADVAIFYTIFCFKRIRTVPNIFLANWAIADLLCLMVAPSGYRILSVMAKTSLSHEFMCFLEEFGATFHVTVLLFIIVTLIDWFIAAHFGGASEKYRNNYVIIIGAIWVFAIIFASIFSGICFHYYSVFVHQILALLISYSLVLLLVVVLQLSRVVQKFRQSPINSPTMNLTLATAFIGCSLLSIINIMSAFFFWYHPAFEIITVVVLFCSSIINLILLLTLNREFRECFVLAVKCKSYNYEDVLPEFNNPIRNLNNRKSDIDVSFRTSQELLTNTD
ncbi:hypothetical protein RN001_012506 [Aquatica leii]|uniref:G-protein coupled receptors family 1 profile domain-containing protein n=1 Tax=Aquatica leii TaxID=1421715 RepID=A0AAN7P359_9COLE|nr:hypothetical protein RN001_012506 [Aquatica leii]